MLNTHYKAHLRAISPFLPTNSLFIFPPDSIQSCEFGLSIMWFHFETQVGD